MLRPRDITGRYAPSPTGDLHLGNLRTALIAWLWVRKRGGRFLLRMEDLDTPRVVAGSADKILHDLRWLGLDWDGPVMYQSHRLDRYQQILNHLTQRQLTFPCYCSRRDIQQAASAPHINDGVYPGTCAALSVTEQAQRCERKDPAIRLRTHGALANDCGDFVLKRADGLFAYQLAVVVDDLDQGITEVVRGADLADSTPRQQYLANLLSPESTSINYFHVPLLLDVNGKRMSKRDGSESVAQWRDTGRTAQQMIACFASELGLLDSEREIAARDLLNEVCEQQLRKVMN